MSLPHLPRVHKNRSSCLSIFPLCLLAFSLSEAYADTIIVPDRGGGIYNIYSLLLKGMAM